jgi:low affinity Fe/Cu permease
MFENIDINYIVIGLIVLTLVCIYLLYNSLNSGSDSLELKKHINELVLQNKKRDEIIHFLVNQVQLLQSHPPMTEIDTTTGQGEHFTNTATEHIPTTVATHEESVNVADINTDDMAKLDKLLNEDLTVEQNTTLTSNDNMKSEDNDSNQEEVGSENNVSDNEEVRDELSSVLEDNESDSDGSQGSDALVDSVLSGDTLPPKDKDLLYVYTVSQLKDYAKNLNISTGGNKDTLINRIFEAL